MVGEVGKAKLAKLEAMEEDDVFERIASGVSVRQICRELECGYKIFGLWLDAAEGRRQAYAEAQHQAGHFYAQRAVDTSQAATPEIVNVARLQVDTDKWMAAKMNAQYDTRQRDVAVNISVTDLHAEASALLNSVQMKDVIDVDAEDVSDA